jgi:hypothetical protein
MSILSDFWGFLWSVVVIFAFVAYIMVLFSIIGDLFRDDRLNGWLKAIWIIFLIFVPFLTALVYLIARGSGMQQRSMAQAAQIRQQQDDYIRATAGSGGSATDEIARAKSLLDGGAITRAEYDAIKAKALA